MNLSKLQKTSQIFYIILSVSLVLFLPLSAHATSIGTNVTVTGTTTLNGNTTIGDSATADTLTVTARLASNLNPNANNAIDLGSFDLAYKSIYASSTAHLNYTSSTAIDLSNILTLVASTTDANTGVIYKDDQSFIHNFSHPTGDLAIPLGQNTFVGLGSGNFTMGSGATYTSEGSRNTGIGYQTLQALTTGFSNIANGTKALNKNTTGSNNVANGALALYSNISGESNIANGTGALFSNTTGSSNTANGHLALYKNTTSEENTANGNQALYENTTGFYNTANGSEALNKNTTGNHNTANGYYALRSNTTGERNTANGSVALFSNTTGNYNIAMGYNAGRYQANGTTGLTTASSSIYIGSFSKGFNNSDINSIVIGDSAVGIGANTVVLGNDSILKTSLKGNVGIASSTPSAQLSIGSDATATSTLSFGALCFRAYSQNGDADDEVYYWPCVGDACPTPAMAAAGWATSTVSCF